MKTTKLENKNRRKRKIRRNIEGDSNRPRLSIFRSNRFIYAQLIDDTKGTTLTAVSEKELKVDNKSKTEKARAIGALLAQKGIKKNVRKVVFDRNGYKYHGRVKALAEGAREGGLKF